MLVTFLFPQCSQKFLFFGVINPLPKKPASAVQAFINTVRKGGIACNKQYLLFPCVLYTFGELCHFCQI